MILNLGTQSRRMAHDKCMECGNPSPWSTDHEHETEAYSFLCSDCRDEIGNGGINE